MEMASWSRASEHLVNPIGMSDQLKWNNQGGRISKTYYQIYLNNQTKIHYTDANAKKTISSVKARVCGSNLEPSVGTRISIKFSADN